MGITSFNTMADVLASEGIINYDAVAYVNGKKPRYFGKPATYANSGMPYATTNGYAGAYSNPYTNQIYGSTSGDAFLKSSSQYKAHKNSKILKADNANALGAGAVILGSAALIAAKFKKLPGIKNGKISNLLSKVSNCKLAQKLKGSQTVQNAGNAVKKFKIPAKLKFLGVTALTLFGAYKVATHEKNNQQIMGSTKSVPQL